MCHFLFLFAGCINIDRHITYTCARLLIRSLNKLLTDLTYRYCF